MISPARERAVTRLLRLGCSQRKIEAITGVSRTLVWAINTGRRAHDASQRAVERRRQAKTEESPARRGVCPACGHRVPIPCVACAAVAEVDRKRARRGGGLVHITAALREMAEHSPVLGLDLKPEHQKRYEEVRGSFEQ